MAEPLQRVMSGAGIANVEVTGRAKHLWSIYRKMEKRERPYEEIYDLLAIRVLVNTVQDCYHALGVIHDGWTPLQERIKDYIAQPKSNGYQSLHTTVFGPGRQLYEIQIRTREMHRTAEIGIAAHWRYKTDAKSADELDRHLQWFRQVLELQLDAKDPAELGDPDRFRVCRAHGSRPALRRRQGQREDRPAQPPAPELGDGGNPYLA
jgi:GTP pyrophosphokinase